MTAQKPEPEHNLPLKPNKQKPPRQMYKTETRTVYPYKHLELRKFYRFHGRTDGQISRSEIFTGKLWDFGVFGV